MAKARAMGINHVALEVGDIDEALAFYGEADNVLRGMGMSDPGKNEQALEELAGANMDSKA